MKLDKKVFGQKIRELRKSKSLTLQQVADAVNTDRMVLSNIERGVRGVSVDTLITLADFFGVSLDYLVGRSDEP